MKIKETRSITVESEKRKDLNYSHCSIIITSACDPRLKGYAGGLIDSDSK